MTKREFSAGGIVFRKKGKGLEVLLINDVYGHWTWPKGHIEQKETSQEAALREIREEVGLSDVRIVSNVGHSNYNYKLGGELMFKTVFFFLAEANNREKISIQKSEIKDARWFDMQKALKTLKYKGARELLKKAIEKYKKEGQCLE